MALLSPGVEVKEIDLSLTVSTAGSSFAAFCGVFPKGPADGALLISDISTLVNYYGAPTNGNYNDFFQCYNFLQYSGSLYIVRVIDRTGQTKRKATTNLVAGNVAEESTEVELTAVSGLYVNEHISFGNSTTVYTIESIDSLTKTITINPELQIGDSLSPDTVVYHLSPSYNAMGEAQKSTGVVPTEAELLPTLQIIANYTEYENVETSIPFSNSTNSKLKFIAKNPGDWGNNIKVAIANRADFLSGTAEIISGVSLNDAFQYVPESTEVAVVVLYNDVIAETYLVSMTPGSKDYTGKSNYIEDVINRKSEYIFCKDNTGITEMPASKLGVNIVSLAFGDDGAPGKDELISAYSEHFGNKEEIDIDIVIANELCNSEVATFCKQRGDVIGYIGVPYDTVVGFKAEAAVSNVVEYITTGDMNIDNKYVSFIGNYMYMYDKYNDKYRWCNLAGSTAGLRAYTNNARQPWFAKQVA